MAKISSYQKLKQQNLQLKQDIYTILKDKNIEKQLITTMKWNMVFDLEEAVWQGNVNK